MQVVSDCPSCQTSYGWEMNRVERTPDGGRRPVDSPDCPRCGYDVTGTNARQARNFHYCAKTDDLELARALVEKPMAERGRLTAWYETQQQAYETAQSNFRPGPANLFGLLKPRAPRPPALPDVPDVNARVQGQGFNPLAVAAIYGSERVARFLLDNGADPSEIPFALEKAKEWGHPAIVALLRQHRPPA